MANIGRVSKLLANIVRIHSSGYQKVRHIWGASVPVILMTAQETLFFGFDTEHKLLWICDKAEGFHQVCSLHPLHCVTEQG
jgi:hypothetical protein